MFRILLADDEPRMRKLVSDFLKRDGYEIVEAADGNEAAAVFDSQAIDLAILDVMMPGLDGWSVLRHIKARRADVPVLMLTARAEDADQVLSFELGADDYVSKPFSPMVLAARVGAIFKRTARKDGGGMFYAGELAIDEERRLVTAGGKEVALTPREYELLIYLKNNKNIALSREKILNEVWGYDYFGDLRGVDTHIKKLRAKLGEVCGGYIATVRGYGYRFEVQL